ncbi:MAG: phosphoribosyltransferase [Planctomycetes bacterium]|nr:phosphoribosyltransferase [Planctomycetota bacterium]
MFRDREDAARRLAWRLKGRPFRDPLVLAIPHGGVVIGAVLARELDADLDVVLARKIHAPGNPELAVGAVSEDGQVYLNAEAAPVLGLTEEYLVQERQHQIDEIARCRELFCGDRQAAPITGRSVIVTDDGIATGSTMMAALQAIKAQNPHEVIVAIPVAPEDSLEQIRRRCDKAVCVVTPRFFWSISNFYEDFPQVGDAEVVGLLRSFTPAEFVGASTQAVA